MISLKDALLEKLRKRGIEPPMIPALIRSIANAIAGADDVNAGKVNERLRFLGWEDFEVDDHILQLVIAHLESGEMQPNGLQQGGVVRKA